MERAQPFQEFCIEKPSLAGLSARVSTGSRVDRFVAQELAHNLIVAGIEIEEDLARCVAEQVDVAPVLPIRGQPVMVLSLLRGVSDAIRNSG